MTYAELLEKLMQIKDNVDMSQKVCVLFSADECVELDLVVSTTSEKAMLVPLFE